MRFYFSLMLFALLLMAAEDTLAGHSRSDFDQPPQIELQAFVVAPICYLVALPQDEAEKPTVVLETPAVSQTRQSYTRLIYFSNGKKSKDYLMVKNLRSSILYTQATATAYQCPYPCSQP